MNALWMLAATAIAASAQLSKPRVEDGGWQPVLAARAKAKKGRAADDIPAFYVWLPTELLDHIHPNGPNFAQIQPPAGFPRNRYLPAQAIDEALDMALQPPRSAAFGPLQSEEEADVSDDSGGKRPVYGSLDQLAKTGKRKIHKGASTHHHQMDGCSPVSSAAVTSLGNRSLRQVADSLGAGRFLDRLGITEIELISLTGHDGAYTLFLPADESLELTSPELLGSWSAGRAARQAALLNHVLPSRVALAELTRGGSFTTRAGARLNVRRSATSGVVTVNGHRVAAADAAGPRGGVVHVLGGALAPAADRDVLATLSDCAKYDGFLTLATGTGVSELLRRGQRTLFLPSNDALSKVPPEELKLYQRNVTALKEFLTYHIVDGIYYSHDLRDGQYLKSMHNDLPIRVGVSVDGCSRRLYEANNSPLYRADIPASNGVIHVVDWVLLPGDHKWCTGVVLP
ncbi:periostin-like isoform X1 [Dermacentor albipictus]|uniref:periostin-like isoform X1 n=1 Tax=Dermacentor albipictus TaxID=60249 RepID=UPI0038FC11C3